MLGAAGKTARQTLDFHHVTHFDAGAVSFHHGGAGWVEPGIFPGSLNGQDLALGVGRRNALALAVAGAADPANDGVDFVAVAFGIGEALEQEGARAFTHDEAVGAGAKRPAAGGAQRPDFTELDEDAGAHVAVNAAGNDRIDMMLGEHLYCRVNSSEAGSARGVGDEVGAAQVEHVGHPAGDDVGKFAGHGVFGDWRHSSHEFAAPVVEHRLLGRSRHAGEFGRPAQRIGIFREDRSHGGGVMHLAAHGGSQNHAGAIGVQRSVGITVVGQRFGSDGHCPLLPFIHGGGHFGRDAIALPVKLKAAHPGADLGIGLVRGSRIRVVIVSNAPAIGWGFDDRIMFVDNVLPKRRRRGRVGEDGA